MQKYPALLCDTCHKNHICPDFRIGCVCADKREFNKFITRNANDVISELRATTNESVTNMQFAMIQEVINGKYDLDVTILVRKNNEL